MLRVIYRLSDNGYYKSKFSNATKIHCLENALRCFGLQNFYLLVDTTNLKSDTKDKIELLSDKIPAIEYYCGGSSAASWRKSVEWSFNNFSLNDHVYFLEDDYWHLPHSNKVLLEGLSRSHYVSLYDHNDTYIPSSLGGNMFVTDAGYSSFTTFIIRTDNSHWRTVSSTTMTFATQLQTLKDDLQIWEKYTLGTHPDDCQAFVELTTTIGRSLITPIPSLSTHCEPAWAAPGINWESIIETEVVTNLSKM
jgi:hypothetical protein